MECRVRNLATAVLLGASMLGLSAVAVAQQAPQAAPRASQQPMEIPPQYQQYPQYPPPSGPQGYPQQSQQGYPQQGGPQQSYPQQQGPTDLGAARMSYVQGDVSTQHSDSSEWAAATLNTPVVNGDHVSTGPGGRAEIQLDHANILRMSDQTTTNVVNLSPAQMQLQVGQGLVNFEVLKGSEADVEIQTPNVAIHPQSGEGSFRILVNSDGETIVDVRKGSAEISTPQGSTRVERNQRITIQGDADNAQYQVSGAPGNDNWDKWNSDRDHVITSAESWQHTNPYYTGSQDLDPYGQWSNVPDYGSVWFPTADPGWAPYRDGRWVFEPYYGWTWVSYEPWGWAPYHYGRWFVYGGNWGWWPGPVYGGYRPIWAPAYVSFLGFGGGGWGVNVGFGFGGGFGSIGWLPIGPGDRFYPWYGRGVNRVNGVNVYNIHNNGGGFAPLREGARGFSNVDRAFTDDRVRAGVSSMSSDQFGRGRVPMQQQRFDAGSLRQASVMTGANPVSPSRESFRPSDRQVNPRSIPNRGSANQGFFSGSRAGGFNRSGNPSGGSQYSGSAGRTSPSRSGYSQPPEPARQYQGPGGGGYGRTPLNMQQPVVTPRGSYSAPPMRGAPTPGPSGGGAPRGGYFGSVPQGRTYSAPPARSAPSAGPYSGGYRGGPSGGAPRGGYSGSAPRGGSSSSGGHSSSGHNRH